MTTGQSSGPLGRRAFGGLRAPFSPGTRGDGTSRGTPVFGAPGRPSLDRFGPDEKTSLLHERTQILFPLLNPLGTHSASHHSDPLQNLLDHSTQDENYLNRPPWKYPLSLLFLFKEGFLMSKTKWRIFFF